MSTCESAHVSIFKHLDYEELEVKLKKSSAKRKIVVTDAVFSIDGDVADIKRLGALKKKYPFLLIVDEAHSTLVYGEFGADSQKHRMHKMMLMLQLGHYPKQSVRTADSFVVRRR